MSTIESIQASGGDYTTPQAWYDAHDGDITGDGNAPYIGEMAAETFASTLDMSASTTDADHYFHLRAQSGSEFVGDFDASYPKIIPAVGTVSIHITDPFTRLEHFGVGSTVTDPYVTGINLFAGATDCIVDGVGVYDIHVSASELTVFVYAINCAASTNRTVIRNCSIGNLSAYNGKAGSDAQCYGIYGNTAGGYYYNNAIDGLTATSADSGGAAQGIRLDHTSGAAYAYNNCVGTLTGTATVCIYERPATTIYSDYNATSDATGGANGQQNITPTDEFVDTTSATLDLHMKAGGQCEDNGLDLITGGYTGAPTEDCDNEERPVPGTWSIGIDHHLAAAITPWHLFQGSAA